MSSLVLLFQGLADLVWCNRRSSSKSQPTKGKLTSRRQLLLGNSYSEKKYVRGDLSNASTDDTDPNAKSSDESEISYSSHLQPSKAKKGYAAPPGLETTAAAPGLEMPNQLESVLSKLSDDDAATVRRLFAVRQNTFQGGAGNRRQVQSTNAGMPSANSLMNILGSARQRSTGKMPAHASNGQWRSSDNARVHHAPRPLVDIPPDDESSLRSNLRKLAAIDSSRVFMVRKINKLGLKSPDFLKEYFNKFGEVEDVFVTHAIDKPKTGENFPPDKARIRPAGIGFIAMSKAEDVRTLLASKVEHTIRGVPVVVSTYEYRAPKEARE